MTMTCPCEIRFGPRDRALPSREEVEETARKISEAAEELRRRATTPKNDQPRPGTTHGAIANQSPFF